MIILSHWHLVIRWDGILQFLINIMFLDFCNQLILSLNLPDQFVLLKKENKCKSWE